MSDEEEYSEEEVEGSEVEESEAAEPVAEAPAETPAEPEPAAEEPEEEEEEQEDEPAAEKPVAAPTESTEAAPKLRKVEKPQHRDSNADGGHQLTEAEQAMQAAKKRHEEEEAAKMADSEARRQAELAQVEQELEVLKQRQIERKKEREVEEREFAERRRKDDERRREDEEKRKAKIEEQKRLKEEEKLKRQQMMAGGFVTTTVGNKRKQRSDEQIQEAKRNYINSLQSNKPDISGLLPNDLKAKIKQLYQKILRLESEKYDLTQRHERQDYDLKELTERQSQQTRNKALALGVEVEQAESGKVRPPKINVASKHDRQKDHRSYNERFEIFEKPYEKPEPAIAHGSGRPPKEWKHTNNYLMEEIEQIRKHLEPPSYVEVRSSRRRCCKATKAPADAEAEPELPSDEPKPEGEEEEEGGGDDAEETQSVAPSERRRSRATIVQEEIDPTTLTEAQQAMLANKKRQEQEAELKAMDADSRRKEELKNIEQELAELKEDKGARNFVITSSGEKKEPEDKKKKGVMSAEQKQAAKANYMSIVNNPADTSNMMPNDIKAKIKQLHAKITRLESEKYDLEKRHERQGL
ncbi:hypothetical protein M3Y97_00928300 [Aphelenchoides bicaudatus]|nr:hypothetical protein M3Y97_00928300 [Aphelenchoides bicaudatus]